MKKINYTKRGLPEGEKIHTLEEINKIIAEVSESNHIWINAFVSGETKVKAIGEAIVAMLEDSDYLIEENRLGIKQKTLYLHINQS